MPVALPPLADIEAIDACAQDGEWTLACELLSGLPQVGLPSKHNANALYIMPWGCDKGQRLSGLTQFGVRLYDSTHPGNYPRLLSNSSLPARSFCDIMLRALKSDMKCRVLCKLQIICLA